MGQITFSQSTRTTPLRRSTTVHGLHVLRLDEDNDGLVDRSDPIIVMRESTRAPWMPVSDPGALRFFLSRTAQSQRSQLLGLWRDKYQNAVRPDRVKPMGIRWASAPIDPGRVSVEIHGCGPAAYGVLYERSSELRTISY